MNAVIPCGSNCGLPGAKWQKKNGEFMRDSPYFSLRDAKVEIFV